MKFPLSRGLARGVNNQTDQWWVTGYVRVIGEGGRQIGKRPWHIVASARPFMLGYFFDNKFNVIIFS